MTPFAVGAKDAFQPTADVFSLGYGLKVPRIHARRISAEVIQDKTCIASQQNVSDPIGWHRAFAESEPTITTGFSCAHPQPARAEITEHRPIEVNLRPEPGVGRSVNTWCDGRFRVAVSPPSLVVLDTPAATLSQSKTTLNRARCRWGGNPATSGAIFETHPGIDLLGVMARAVSAAPCLYFTPGDGP